MSDREWAGRIQLDETAGIFVGNGGVAPLHAHHAFKIVVPLEGEVRIESRVRGRLRAGIAVVHPNEPHHVEASASRLALLYVEPQSLLGRSLCWHEQHASGRWADAEAEAIVRGVSAIGPEGLPSAEALLGGLVRRSPPLILDRRVRQTIERIDAEASKERRIPEFARTLGLSPSRLSHLFAESLGISVARYRRWRRLRRAMTFLASGEGVTTAAHATGFADAAHLCRTFMSMMGITPGIFARMSLIGGDERVRDTP